MSKLSAASQLKSEKRTGRRVSIDQNYILDFDQKPEKQAFLADLGVATEVDTTNDMEYTTAWHCMHCWLGQKHDCRDPGWMAEYTPRILRKILYLYFDTRDTKAPIGKMKNNEKVVRLYPIRATYLVQYLGEMPTMPYHDHPGGEEYLVFEGAFNDNITKCPSISWVKYPIGTEHEATPDSTVCLTWWGQDNGVPAKKQDWWNNTSGDDYIFSGGATELQICTFNLQLEEPIESIEVSSSNIRSLGLYEDINGFEKTWVVYIPAGVSYSIKVGKFGTEWYIIKGSMVDLVSGSIQGPGYHVIEPPREYYKKLGPIRLMGCKLNREKFEGALVIFKTNHMQHINPHEAQTGDDMKYRVERRRSIV